jgi:hypothetical protein
MAHWPATPRSIAVNVFGNEKGAPIMARLFAAVLAVLEISAGNVAFEVFCIVHVDRVMPAHEFCY